MKAFGPKYIWFDGRFVARDRAQVPLTTHAIHYGTSAFEGIRAYWNSENLCIFRLGDHIRRFRRSGKYYSMSLRFTDAQIRDAVTGLCRKNRVRESCYIRPFYFVGQHGVSLHVTERSPTHAAVLLLSFQDIFDKDGISAHISPWRKFSGASTPTQAKMGGNYLNSIIATQEAKRRGFDEAILLDSSGSVGEAPGENIFIVKNGRLATPPVSSALKGITRDTVLRMGRAMGLEVSVRRITRRQLYGADEVLLCGTAAEIVPVTRIDRRKIADGRPGEITRRLMDQYSDIVMNRNRRYSRWITEVY